MKTIEEVLNKYDKLNVWSTTMCYENDVKKMLKEYALIVMDEIASYGVDNQGWNKIKKEIENE